jgi:hypothetical protein
MQLEFATLENFPEGRVVVTLLEEHELARVGFAHEQFAGGPSASDSAARNSDFSKRAFVPVSEMRLELRTELVIASLA